ncbi:MAG: lycopene beta-cyclase CrtY [Archangium sp.]|nr:lycopene beta-cyclase CrtY [Archangium sp.]
MIILVGAGLANGLLADRLLARWPGLDLLVLEGGAAPGGNHTWCFHESDVPPATLEWLRPFISASWRGYDVAFPGLSRSLPGTYFAVRSEDFAKQVTSRLGQRLRTGVKVREVKATSVVLDDGTTLEASVVIDGRGWVDPDRSSRAESRDGFQKFLGQEVLLKQPHGLTRPLLMDATVPQLDGFRFVYVLPWDERRVLVEDTRYSDTPSLDAEAFRSGIATWLASRGWEVERVLREEAAALPIPLSGAPGVLTRPTVGVAAGFFHATTGYSLPFAAATAELIGAQPSLEADQLTRLLNGAADLHWREMRFFRLLNRMLFRGAEPQARVRVFESFYRHEPALIDRFYAGRLRWTDKLAALRRGASTVPPVSAMRAAWS